MAMVDVVASGSLFASQTVVKYTYKCKVFHSKCIIMLKSDIIRYCYTYDIFIVIVLGVYFYIPQYIHSHCAWGLTCVSGIVCALPRTIATTMIPCHKQKICVIHETTKLIP